MIAALAFALLLASAAAGASEVIAFEPAELATILRHGPWPPPAPRDPSNRASGNADAIALGRALFFDTRLSPDGRFACASCHLPEKAWTDGLARARGHDELDRNTPSLYNVGLQRWFGWDGSSDTLWSQSVKPMVAPNEMAANAKHVAAMMRADPGTARLHESVFGAAGDDEMLVNAGKALAAFQETLVSGRTSFDAFRDALARGDRAAAARYPLAAQRGLKIFAGRGNCSVCHFGPAFTNGEFHDVGVPFFAAPGRVDAGRYDGIKRLTADPLNLLGRYSDDASGTAATRTRHVELVQSNYGQFKTPSLRNAPLTAPYMHNGRYATLREVVLHYSDIDTERIHSHGERLLQPLGLSSAEIDDLTAFLETLSDPTLRR